MRNRAPYAAASKTMQAAESFEAQHRGQPWLLRVGYNDDAVLVFLRPGTALEVQRRLPREVNGVPVRIGQINVMPAHVAEGGR